MSLRSSEPTSGVLVRKLRYPRGAWMIYFVLFSIPLIAPMFVGFDKYISSNLYILHFVAFLIVISLVMYLYQEVDVFDKEMIVRRFYGLKLVSYAIEFSEIDKAFDENPIKILLKNGRIVFVRWTMFGRQDKLFLRHLLFEKIKKI